MGARISASWKRWSAASWEESAERSAAADDGGGRGGCCRERGVGVSRGRSRGDGGERHEPVGDRRGRGQQSPRRKSEWWCLECGAPNFVNRRTCRDCGVATTGQEVTIWGTNDGGTGYPPEQRVVNPTAQRPLSPTAARKNKAVLLAAAEPKPRPQQRGQRDQGQAGSSHDHAKGGGELSHAERARALEKQAAQLLAMGAADATVEMVTKEAAGAWKAHREARPMGQRLDQAEARRRRAEETLGKCADAVKMALERYQNAELECQAAEDEVEQVRRDAATRETMMDAGTVHKLARAAKDTIEWLETHAFGEPGAGAPPEALVQRIAAVRSALEEGESEDDHAAAAAMDEDQSEAAAEAMGELTPGSPQSPGRNGGLTDEEIELAREAAANAPTQLDATQVVDHGPARGGAQRLGPYSRSLSAPRT